MVLEEFDCNKKAIINPEDLQKKISDFPRVGASCFSLALFERIVNILKAKKIAETGTASTPVPIYEITYQEVRIAFYMSPVGAPACVAIYEDLIAMGLQKLVLFGTCGVLDRTISDCSIIIPTSALRDEGTSYHYMPACEEIEVNKKGVDIFKKILSNHHYNYSEGKVWTTDACYRETREKLEKRKNSGCVCVDMECSAMAAVAAFRESELFHFFYAADNLDSEHWDARSLGNLVKLNEKEKIALLALELASKL